VNSCITTDLGHPGLKHPVSSPHLLVVGEQKRSGLILCKQYYAEFAGPGAAICNPFKAGYERIIAIGSPEIIEVTSYEERQQAYGRRIQWVRWLQRIVSEPEATQRAEKLFAGFEEFFGSEILSGLPNDVLALLAGVLPHTITLLRSQHEGIGRGNQDFSPSSKPLDITVILLQKKADRLNADFSSFTNNHPLKALGNLPCSA